MGTNIDIETGLIIDMIQAINTKHIIMLVGLPGSGKTRLRNIVVDKCGHSVVSRDDVIVDICSERGLMYKDAFCGAQSYEIQKLADHKLSKNINSIVQLGQNAIIDMTCLTRSSRAKKIAPFADYTKIAIECFRDAGSILEVNDSRVVDGRNLSTSQILHMSMTREPVSVNEGFSAVFRYGGLTKLRK